MRSAAVIQTLVVAIAASTAAAEPSPADAAFERGRALIAAGHVVEACVAFEDSLRLDFQYGTLFNLAQCNERRGKLATAFAQLQRIAGEDANNPARAQRARELAAALEPRVPTLHVTILGLPARVITLDGAPLDLAQPARIDLGSHDVVTDAVHREVVVTREGEVIDLAISMPRPRDVAPPLTIAPPRPPPAERHRRTPVLITFGGGLAIASTGLVLGAVAWKRWDDAQSLATNDPVGANREVGEVRTLGTTSTVLVTAGAVAIAVGVYLWHR